MKRKVIFVLVALTSSISVFAQFHTLNIPRTSPKVTESQRLGVTDITIDYSSPALRGRDVWNTEIPKEGNPIPWRAGANMATTVSFSTDVLIEEQPLKAGIYGFHIIPKDDTYTLLFAHAHDQWGSYYLDVKKDISLKVTVNPEKCAKSEQLDYEFLNRNENSLVIGLEWGEKRIPFKVEVDLNKTVVESFRSELRGINTYHWQAWNDAALWCLNHNTNLEEALTWANRSINGGYGGFAANKNPANMVTKLRLLKKIGNNEAFDETFLDMQNMHVDSHDANEINIAMLRFGKHKEALEYASKMYKNYPEAWSLLLNRGIANYFSGNKTKAIKDVQKVIPMAPEQFANRLNEIIDEFKTDTYKLTPY